MKTQTNRRVYERLESSDLADLEIYSVLPAPPEYEEPEEPRGIKGDDAFIKGFQIMSSESKKPLSLEIAVWVSPAEETWYEPAWILTYDDEGVAIRSKISYAARQEILIGMDSPGNGNGRHGIEALLKARIFWSRRVETEKDDYFEYQAKFIIPT